MSFFFWWLFTSSPANDFTFRAPRPPAPKYLLRSISAGLLPPQLRAGEQQSGPPDASCPSPVSRAACGHTYWECMIWVLLFWDRATPFFFMIHYSFNKQIRANQWWAKQAGVFPEDSHIILAGRRKQNKKITRDFSGGPVAKTLRFQCRGPRSDP